MDPCGISELQDFQTNPNDDAAPLDVILAIGVAVLLDQPFHSTLYL